MTVGELISILSDYMRENGENAYVVVADNGGIIDDANSVGVDYKTGDIVISTQNY